MSNISSFSSLTTMLQTSNIICRSINLTDELKIGVEYDIQYGLLNIFVKNTGDNNELPSHINILSNQYKDYELKINNNEYLLNSSEIQQDFKDEITDVPYGDEDEPKICIELSNIYVYDLYDENDLCQTMITSSPLLFSSSLSSSSSSCFDEQTTDNDDGYSTHSLDDIDQQQQQSISIPPSKLITPFVPYQHHYYYYSENYVSSIHRLFEQLMWLSPFKKTVKQMMINHLLD